MADGPAAAGSAVLNPAREAEASPGNLAGYDIGQQVGFLLRRAHQRHVALFQEAMARLDLTPTQFNALVRVVEAGAVGQNQLGRLSAMDPATIQGVVRRLEERGLVQRRPDPADRRATILAATERGLALSSQAVVVGAQVTKATLAPLSAAERRQLLKALEKIG
jgi:DNA-binding MarR family transcriptional regulator